jgi:hypothetical protein
MGSISGDDTENSVFGNPDGTYSFYDAETSSPDVGAGSADSSTYGTYSNLVSGPGDGSDTISNGVESVLVSLQRVFGGYYDDEGVQDAGLQTDCPCSFRIIGHGYQGYMWLNHYQLYNKAGQALNGNGLALEHVWKASGTGNVTPNLSWEQMLNGQLDDLLGPSDPPDEDSALTVDQTFSVYYQGQYINVTTEFQHTIVVNDGNVVVYSTVLAH